VREEKVEIRRVTYLGATRGLKVRITLPYEWMEEWGKPRYVKLRRMGRTIVITPVSLEGGEG